MSRLQKKCLMASTSTHVVLLLILLAGSAFLAPKEVVRPAQSLKVIPSILVDSVLAGGGGDPKVAESDDRQKGDVPVPQPAPPAPPKRAPVKQVRKEPEPPKEAPKKVAPPAQPKKETKPAPEAKKVEPRPRPSLADLKPVKPAARPRQDTGDRELARELEQAARALRSGFASGTAVEVHGTGGPAYANYESLVKARYDDAWLVAGNVEDDGSTVKVSVTIARDGDVIEARIIRGSTNPALDQSVQRALDSVKFVAPFPSSWSERKRTFIINFNLGDKRAVG